jgi:MFS family permease
VPTVDVILAVVAATAATLFTLDLLWDLRRSFRPHTAAYAIGIGMFAAATWALAAGLANGWTGPAYRVFFLFGAVLNIPFLALGSMFLVVGRRSGNAMTIALGGFSAISVTLVTTAPFAGRLPSTGVPSEIFPPIGDGFGPRLLAAIGSGTGATILIVLALVSAIRFWKRNRRLVWGNLLIVGGTLAGATGGSMLGFLGETAAFELSLLATATLIWAGYRTARGARKKPAPKEGPLLVLVGPSTAEERRERAEGLILALERAGFRVMCPARDIEAWGEVAYSPAESMRRVFRTVDEATAVVVDLEGGYGTVTAGYARAVRVPVVVAALEGERIPRPLRGVASAEIFYGDPDELADRLHRELQPWTRTR